MKTHVQTSRSQGAVLSTPGGLTGNFLFYLFFLFLFFFGGGEAVGGWGEAQ